MPITADSQFRNLVRITRPRFIEVLGAKASPRLLEERDPGQYWDWCITDEIDPLYILAKFNHESSMGKAGVAVQTHSWGNTRQPNFGATPVMVENDEGELVVKTVPGRSGEFPVWANWMDGLKSTTGRLNAPDWVYFERTKIREIYDWPPDQTLVWAPAGDMNNPNGYLRAMLDFMNAWQDTEETHNVKPRIALSAGHHNSSGGGTPGEHARTGPLTREIAHLMQAAGVFDVHIITPDDGLGDHPGSLSGAARVAVEIGADLFLEVHFEGNGAGNAGRGSFAIYPDWADDLDVDVRDRLGPAMAAMIQEYTGIPKRGNGTMSEKSTGVGSQGFRLGVFGATASAKATMTRLIYEYGALTAPADKAIIDSPEFNRLAAQATVEAIAAFYGVEVKPPAPGPQPEPEPIADEHRRYFEQAGKWVVLGFKALWEQTELLDSTLVYRLVGLPRTNEGDATMLDGSVVRCQFFERAVFKYDPTQPSPWDLVCMQREEVDAIASFNEANID